MRIAIVGGVAGGASCAARARRLSETAEIVIYERGPHVSFANCGLPYFVGGEIRERRNLVLQTPEALGGRFALDVRVMTEVVGIDREARRVTLENRLTGERSSEPYDALVLATGAAPLRPRIPGIERPGHFTVRNIPDVEALTAWVEERKARTAVVIGGGFIGLEMAEQLRHRGLEVHLVEALPQVMAPLDPEMAAWLHRELRDHGVDLHLEDGVAAFEAPASGESALASTVVLRSGTRLPADVVILGLGVRPEVGLARDAGLEIGPTGGIRVDEYLRTSDPAIWAVGDVIEVVNTVTGRPMLIPLAGPANRQGRFAADNILGRPSRYRGTLGTGILRLFDLTAGTTGANERMLREAGMPFQAVHLHPNSHAGYFPGAHPIALKVLFSPEDGRILGAQAVGRDGVDKRIDVIATAIRAGMTIEELADVELAYAPPFSSAKDPVNMAGFVAGNVRNGDVGIVHWNELEALDALLVDVRSEAERARGYVPGSVHMPLDQVRGRLGELPRDREIVVYCHSGQRSYYAARILAQNGFRVRNLSGSFRTWSAVREPAVAERT